MRYAVIGELGRGGMGRVLRAYDPLLQREVALKHVRSDLLGGADARRLVDEARAMAKLSHANVVAVYDVEQLADDQVVIVMEFVAGQTLGAWLQERRRWQDIVARFRGAGRGLAAAHAAGLLHRDFKPDNVLVGVDGRVRVTDFGLARAVAIEHSEETSRATIADGLGTTLAGTIVGTLPYLAPERLMGAPATAASDQFAFCVALWEALFGTRPFAGSSPFELAFAMAAGRPRPPPWAPRVPARLLAAIVRGVASDPRARWPSMHALLDALARDASRRRRRWLHAAGIGALGIGVVVAQALGAAQTQHCSEVAARAQLQGTWDEARRAQVQRAVLGIGAAYATGVWTRTEQALDEYASAWTRMRVDACAATTVRGEQSEAVMDLRMGCLDRARLELDAVTQVLARADPQAVQKAHEVVGTLRPLARCADVEALQAEVEPPLPAEADAVARVRNAIALARAELRAGRYADARGLVESATAELADLRYGPVRAELAIVHATLLDRLGDYEGARDQLRSAMRLAARWRQPRELRDAASFLVYASGYRLQRFAEAMRHAELAHALAAGDPEREATVANGVAVVLGAQGKYDESEAEHRRALALREQALGPDHDDTTQSRNNLVVVLAAQRKYEEAEAGARSLLALRVRTLGPDHPLVAMSRGNLAAILQPQMKHAEAETEIRLAIAVREAALGRDHPELAHSYNNLGNILFAKGELEPAEAAYRRSLALEHALDERGAAETRHNLGLVLFDQGELDEAERELRSALAILERVLGPEHPHAADAHHGLGRVMFAQGDHAGAEAELRRALALREAKLNPEHPSIALSRTSLAEVLLARGVIAEARALAEAAWTRRRQHDVSAAERAESAFVLARVCWAAGADADRRRARELAERALAEQATRGDEGVERAAKVEAWLAAADVGWRR